MELRGKVISGFGWTAVEKLSSALFQIVVSIIVINHIVPDDTMMVAIVAAIIAVLNTFVDSGFSQTLIRKLEATERDFSSVFFFNMSIALVLYVVLVLLSGPIARLYEVPMLAEICPIMFLLIPIREIEVTGEVELFNEGEIIEASECVQGKSLHWRSSGRIERNIRNNLPLTEEVKVTKSLFGKIKIDI